MRKLLALLSVAVSAMLVVASPAMAGDHHGNGDHHKNGGHHKKHGHGKFECNGTFTGVTLRDVVVEPFGVCELFDSDVNGDVEVEDNGDFEATNSSIREDVEANRGQTVFLPFSDVGGSVETHRTAQVFVFDSVIDDGIKVQRSTDQVFLCNNDVGGHGITVRQSGTDILVGDHLNPDCPGNFVTDGNIVVSKNPTDVELAVSDNFVPDGSMFVFDNTGTPLGSFDKAVQGNVGGRTLACDGNEAPFVGSPNPGWLQYQGQCSA